MTAREYLSQLNRLEKKIDRYLEEIQRIRLMLLPKGITYDKDKVQISVADKVTDDIIKLIELEEKCTKAVRAYHEQRDHIIEEIFNIPTQRYSDVLEKVYLDKKSLKKCAELLDYDYNHIRHLHIEALKEFEKTYPHIKQLR